MPSLPLGLISQGGGAVTAAPFLATIGGAGIDYGYGSYVDVNGNLYVSGQTPYSATTSGFLGSQNANGGALNWQTQAYASGVSGMFTGLAGTTTRLYASGYFALSNQVAHIVAYDYTGAIQWQRKLTASANNSYGYAATVDPSGNPILAGSAYYATNGSNNPLIAKYNSTGTLQWQSGMVLANAEAYAVATDTSGNVVAAGVYPGNGGFVAKWTSAGTFSWGRNYQFSATESLTGIGTDSSGNVYAMGTNTGNAYPCLLKIDSTGTLQWQKRFFATGSTNRLNNGLVVDSSGNSYMTWSSGSGTAIIAKYDNAGTLQWNRSLARTSGTNLVFKNIALDGTGNFVMSGVTDTGSNDIFTLKLPTDGSKTGAYTLGAATYTYAAAGLSDTNANFSPTSVGSGFTTTTTDAAAALSTATPALTVTRVLV